MKKTDIVSSTRTKCLLAVLGIIVLVHLIVIGFTVLPAHLASKGKSVPASGEPDPQEEAAQKSPRASENASAGGAAVQDGKDRIPASRPGVSRQYRKPGVLPGLGTPLDYNFAVRGNLPKMPGGSLAGSGILVDLNSRRVLWCKNEYKGVPIASMTKMMTLLLAFEALETHPDWSLDMPVSIARETTRAAREGVIWLDVRETLPLRSLMMAAAIKSANDAAYQIAYTVSGGNVESFVAKMNARAAALKMKGARFVNPHGLPGKNGNTVCSAEGMILLGERWLEYPDLMEWAGTQQAFIARPLAKDGKSDLKNTNHLVVPRYPGVDGLKTGYTRAARYCLTFTAIRNGKRLMGCVTGFPTAKERDIFARRMLDWGFTRAMELDSGKKTVPAASAVSVSVERKKR